MSKDRNARSSGPNRAPAVPPLQAATGLRQSLWRTRARASDTSAFEYGAPVLAISARGLVATAAIIGVSSVAAFAAKPDLGEVAAALIFVLGITLAGAFVGLAAALIAASSAFLLYNFFLTEPVLTFRLTTGSDITPLIVFNLCAIIAGVLAGRLKDSAEDARRSNLHLIGLLRTSRLLQSAVRTQDIAAILPLSMLARTGERQSLFLCRNDRLTPLGPLTGDPWEAFALRVFASPGQSLKDGGITGYRLEGSNGVLGVFVIESAVERLDTAFMPAFTNLLALALERAMLSEQITESKARARTEELTTALLSSVSHDFRTPLTAISASASSLIDYREQLEVETSTRLLRGIVDECDRLNRYTANLLEMSRIEAGQTSAALQRLDISEMLASAVSRVKPRARHRRIVRAPCGRALPVDVDATLFELALVNILDNAILYSPDHTDIMIRTDIAGSCCEIAIADEGRGIPAGDVRRVFDRFYRVSRKEASPPGSGLGLAIAKGFVEAIGGEIAAATPGIGDRGTCITIRVPMAGTERPAS